MKQKKKIQEEIDCWKMHLESIDKTNINISNSNYLALFGIIIALLATFIIGIMSLERINIIFRIIGALIIFIICAYGILKLKNRYEKELKSHHISLVVRERMLRERYGLLGVDREALDKEFEEIKKIYKSPNSSMREFLVREYYKKEKGNKN